MVHPILSSDDRCDSEGRGCHLTCHGYYSAAVTGEGENFSLFFLDVHLYPDRVDVILVGGTLCGVYYKHVGLYVIHAIHESIVAKF